MAAMMIWPTGGNYLDKGPFRLGFTLLELLIVIGVIAVLLGLSVGAWRSMQGGQGIVAAEHLAVDFLRQARYTARANGAPVLLVFDAEANEMRGIARTPMVHEYGENLPAFLISDEGRNGQGLWLRSDATPEERSHARLRQALDPIPRQNRLERPGRQDGWILTVAVRPPLASVVNSGRIIPLVAILPHDKEKYQDAACGLLLEQISTTLQRPADPVHANIVAHGWQVVGWRVAGGTRTILTTSLSGGPSQRDQDNNGALIRTMPGLAWYELSLVWDGQDLRLLRGSSTLTCTTTHEASEQDPLTQPTMLIGQLAFDEGTQTANLVADAPLDDVGLWRLGSDQPTRLPPGTAFERSGRMLLGPDGSINGSTEIIIRDTRTESATAIIRVVNGG